MPFALAHRFLLLLLILFFSQTQIVILIVVLILVGMVYKGNNNSFKDLNYQRVNSILTTQWRAIIDWVHICMTGDQSAPKDAQRASTAISDDSSHLTTNPFHAPTSTTERSHFIPQTEYHEGKRYSIASGVDDDVENMKDDEEVSIELSHIVHNSPAKQSSSPTSPHKSPSTS